MGEEGSQVGRAKKKKKDKQDNKCIQVKYQEQANKVCFGGGGEQEADPSQN